MGRKILISDITVYRSRTSPFECLHRTHVIYVEIDKSSKQLKTFWHISMFASSHVMLLHGEREWVSHWIAISLHRESILKAWKTSLQHLNDEQHLNGVKDKCHSNFLFLLCQLVNCTLTLITFKTITLVQSNSKLLSTNIKLWMHFTIMYLKSNSTYFILTI